MIWLRVPILLWSNSAGCGAVFFFNGFSWKSSAFSVFLAFVAALGRKCV